MKVKLRYVDVGDDVVRKAFALELSGSAEAAKDKVLRLLAIVREDGEAHLTAWCRTMHAENALPYQQPAHPAIREVYESTPAIARFVWWLA